MDSNLLETEIFDFTNPRVMQSWFVVDDGVMGGTSRVCKINGVNGVS
jgi:hypothetical protein